MKRFFAFAMLWCAYSLHFAQQTEPKEAMVVPAKNRTEIISESTVYENVTEDAEFPGGIQALRNKVAQNFDTSRIKYNKQNSVLKTIITFVVERDGTISQIKTEGTNPTMNAAAMDCIKKIKDLWKPAKKDGTPVRSRFKLPLTMAFE